MVGSNETVEVYWKKTYLQNGGVFYVHKMFPYSTQNNIIVLIFGDRVVD